MTSKVTARAALKTAILAPAERNSTHPAPKRPEKAPVGGETTDSALKLAEMAPGNRKEMEKIPDQVGDDGAIGFGIRNCQICSL